MDCDECHLKVDLFKIANGQGFRLALVQFFHLPSTGFWADTQLKTTIKTLKQCQMVFLKCLN